MLTVSKRRQVKELLECHRALVTVASIAGVSLSSVKRIAKERFYQRDDEAERRARRIGRPSKIQLYRDSIGKLLGAGPDLKSVEILERIRELGYDGGKTSAYALIAELRRERALNERPRYEPYRQSASAVGLALRFGALGRF